MKKIAPVDKKSIRQTANPLQTTNPLQRETHFKDKKPETIPEPEVKEPEIEQLKKKLSLIEEKVDAISRLLLELNETRKSQMSPDTERMPLESCDGIKTGEANPQVGLQSGLLGRGTDKWAMETVNGRENHLLGRKIVEWTAKPPDGPQKRLLGRENVGWTAESSDGRENRLLDPEIDKWTAESTDGPQNRLLDGENVGWTAESSDGSQDQRMDRRSDFWTPEPGNGPQNAKLGPAQGKLNTVRTNGSQDGKMDLSPGKREANPLDEKPAIKTGAALAESIQGKENSDEKALDIKQHEKEGLLGFGRLLASIPPKQRRKRANRKAYLEFVKKYPTIDFPFTQTIKKGVEKYGIEAVVTSERLVDEYISKFCPKKNLIDSMLIPAKILVLLNKEAIAPASQFKAESGISRTSFNRAFSILIRMGFVQNIFASKRLHYAITEQGRKFLSEDKNLSNPPGLSKPPGF